MKAIASAVGVVFMLATLVAQTTSVNFETDTVGKPPSAWIATQTGSGHATWTVEQEDSAPSKTHVLKQSGVATYPVCLKNDTNLRDGVVEVKFKPVSGKEDTSNVWHTLRVDFQGAHFMVTFDGKTAIEWDDDTFKDPGQVGVWTKADSVTLFDDFSYSGR